MAEYINQDGIITADRLHVVYYTDPLCCWSWAFEANWKKIQRRYRDIISVRYCMGGLIERWSSYHDVENSVSKPIQMGPVWMQTGHITGVQIDSTVWAKDPPSSSYLACTAVKCVAMQSLSAADLYLSMLRHAIMVNGRNIAKQSVLIEFAKNLLSIYNQFSIDQFEIDLVNGTGFKAFTADLQEVRYRNINRFPTLVINKGDKAGIIITGYRPEEQLINSIDSLIKA